MIFVTVGTQLPFDRLVKAIDGWAGDNPARPAFAQIGDSSYHPRHLAWTRQLSPDAFRQRLQAASLIVSHAGIGNLLLALETQKPLMVMPRRAELGEHRNDHQLATAKWLKQVPGVTVVDDAAELRRALECAEWGKPLPLRAGASPELLAAVRDFIDGR